MHLKFQISDLRSHIAKSGLFVSHFARRGSSLFMQTWWYFRQITGDAAYENYLRRVSSHCTHQALLSREEFYLDALRRRYTGISRCC